MACRLNITRKCLKDIINDRIMSIALVTAFRFCFFITDRRRRLYDNFSGGETSKISSNTLEENLSGLCDLMHIDGQCI